MKLRDIISILDCDEFYIQDGEKIECIRIYDGDDLEEYMDREVKRIVPNGNAFDIDLA